MKIYLFDATSGLYEGEDYWEPGEVSEADGATKLAPPKTQPGQLSVYDRTAGAWKSVPAGNLKNAVNPDE